MTSSYFNQTAASIAAAAAGNNLTAIAEIYKGHERLSPESMYSGAQPDLVFNIIAMALFYLFTFWQCVLYIIYKNKYFSVCMILFLVGQAIGYMGRVLSVSDITGLSLNNENYFLLQFISLTISPNFFNAAVYSQYGKLLYTYATTKENVMKLNVFGKRVQPMLISVLFITSDITCLAIQGAGGGIEGSSINNSTSTSMDNGNDIFIAGLALQTASMSLFMMVYAKFLYNVFIRQRIEYLNSHMVISSQNKLPHNATFFTPWKWHSIYKSVSFEEIDPVMCNIDVEKMSKSQRRLFHTYPFALFVAFGLALIRCIYRLVELSDGGFSGFLITHEHFLISLDFVPLSLCCVIMCFYAEGLVFGKKGLLKIYLIKMSSYGGLSSWKELKLEYRYMFNKKIDEEFVNTDFTAINTHEDELEVHSTHENSADFPIRPSNAESAFTTHSKYLKKSEYYEKSLVKETNSPWWKLSFNKKTKKEELENFEKEKQLDYESSLKNSMEHGSS